MAGSLNKVCLLGNLGRDPEIRTTQNGKKIANFSIATSERWKSADGQQQERTEWHRIVVFSDGLVGVVERYVKKGSKLYIEGQLQTRKWQDQQGQDKYTTEIVLKGFNSTLLMLDSRNSMGGGGGAMPSEDADMGGSQVTEQPMDYNSSSNLDDEIPF